MHWPVFERTVDFRVSDHEKDEKLILGAGDGRDLGLPRFMDDPRAQKGQGNERDDIGGADMKATQPPDDERA